MGLLQYNIARLFCLKCYNCSVTKIPIAIVHATRASLEPVNRFYATHAPQLDLYNLLDDGLMRYLDAVDMERADKRFISMLETARDEYGAHMAMLTCSAVPAATMAMLRAWDSSFAVIKIDEPMTAQAVGFGNKIGVLATFPATVATTHGLLVEAARGRKIEMPTLCIPHALQSLFDGDRTTHDALVRAAAMQMVAVHAVDGIVLAQVSMAHLASDLSRETGVPVVGSHDTSLAAILQITSR